MDVYPYQGGNAYRVFNNGLLISETFDDPLISIANAVEVYLGGHTYDVSEAKATELRAAGFFVGGFWEAEHTRWEQYVLTSEVDRAFKTGDATCSIQIPVTNQGLWIHADTIVGTYVDEFIDSTALVKNSAILIHNTNRTHDGQIYSSGSGIDPAWAHPVGGEGLPGFTPMDAVWDSGVPGTGDPLVFGWAEPTVAGVAFQEGLICRLNAFLGVNSFTEYPVIYEGSPVSAHFLVTAVHTNAGFHYMLARHWNLNPVLPGGFALGAPFVNGAQTNFNRLARCPVNNGSDFSQWTFWDGTQWTSDQSQAVHSDRAILRDTHGEKIDAICDITFHNNQWVLAAIHPGRPNINLYTATNITDPWHLYYQSTTAPRNARVGKSPPQNLEWWFGYPKFHEYLNPDSNTFLVTSNQGKFNPILGQDQGPEHSSTCVPVFHYLPKPEV